VDRELVFVRAGFGAGALDYMAAWDLQRELHARRVAGEIPDTCLLLEHQPVYTAGKRTSQADRPIGDPGAPVIDVDRGGKITWHGPGQLVGYPIVALDEPVDVIGYVRAVEGALIRTCADAGLATERVEGRSGVWVRSWPAAAAASANTASAAASANTAAAAASANTAAAAASANTAVSANTADRKVAAIGIRVARGVTMHGFALNCDNDLSWFGRIVPCGISDASVTSLSAELGRAVPIGEVIGTVERHLAEILGASQTRELASTDGLLASPIG
jgi:lipoyl(octanoyl) transferase